LGLALQSFLRGDIDHPADPEPVLDHAEARRKKGLGERHAHLPAIGERIEAAIGSAPPAP
jgi:hypothetical protein